MKQSILLCLLVLSACSRVPDENARHVKFYQSPMHPWITSDHPGHCTICGMDLVPIYEGDEAVKDTRAIPLHAASAQVLNVTAVPVRRMELTKTLRFSGILEDNENIHRILAAFYDGRIEKIYVEHVGEYVEKGAPLAAIYSPELLYVVREFQTATRGGDPSLIRSSSRRLVQFGLSPDQVAALAKSKDDAYTVDLLAPMSGTILVKKAHPGQYIKTGEPLFEMGDLSRLWFHAEVYERDLADIRIGQKAVVITPTVPGREFEGTVTFMDPNFDPVTRSTKIRIEVDNPLSEDPQGLRRVLPYRAYAEAALKADLGTALVLPRSAVLRDGRRTVVYVQTAEGAYEPRDVVTGRVGDEGIEILTGLTEGERVVVHGNLMIDAEAQLRGNLAVPELPAGVPLVPQENANAFLQQLAKVSHALALDDAVDAVASAHNLSTLAAAITPVGNDAADAAIRDLQDLESPLAGSDLKALRKAFLPWSQAGSALAAVLAHGGQSSGVTVFECPMTGDSFPGAPSKARWVQSGHETLNPYFGAEMQTCGSEVKP